MTLNEAIEQSRVDFANGMYPQCEHLCAQILQLQRTNPTALFLTGKLSEIAGNQPRAAEHYRTAALTFPNNVEFVEAALRTAAADQRAELEAAISKAAAAIPGFPNKPGLQEAANPAGRMLVPLYPEHDIISQTILAGNIFEPPIVDVARQYIRPGTVVIDIGANFGQMTLLFAQMTGPSGHVYSIEADNYVHHILSENLRLNGVTNVTPILKAAHERDGGHVFFPDQDFKQFLTYGSYGIDPRATQGRHVEMMTIDSLDIQREVSFMKVDVQGCDLFAMRGAVQTIKRHGMPIIFEYEEQFQDDFGTSFEDYVTFTRDIGYKFVKTVNNINYIIVPK